MAKSRAQQAAIAISMKKAGKKPRLRKKQKGGEYTVKSGDAMYKIAKKYNMSTSDLMALNPEINERGDIRPGQKIITKAPSESFFDNFNLPSGKKAVKEVLQTSTGINQADFLGLIPANVKAFVSDITGIGKSEGITEKDLNNREKKALREAIKRAEEKGKNYIEYPDFASAAEPTSDIGGGTFLQGFAPITKYFDPKYSMKTLLGQAKFKKNKDGTYTVTDQFNFNDASKAGFKGVIADIKDQGIAGLSPYKFARNIARNFGSAEGEGMDVNITFQKGGVSDTIKVSSTDQAVAKKKLQNKFNGRIPNNAVLTYDKDTGKYTYTVPPTPPKVDQKKEGGYPKSSNKEFMRRMGYYQGGGLNQTPMYGSNTIPGTPETAAITYQEADQSRLKALEEQLKEAQESTKFQDEAEAEVAKQASTISGIEQGLSQGVKGLDKLGAFDKLKEKGAEKTEALSKLGENAATNLARVGATKADEVSKILADQLIPKGGKVIDVAKDKLNMGLGTDYMGGFGSDQAAKFGEMLQQSNPQQVILREGAEEALKQTTTNVASGLTPAQYGNIGAVASLAGEGIKMASDDKDATTMNVGESVGSGLSGVGTGIGAATTTAMLMGAPLGPVGMAAGVIGGAAYGLGKGLIQRGKARREEEKAERKKEKQLSKIGTQSRLEALKSKQYSGFDFGADVRQGGGFSGTLDNIQDGLTLAGLAGPVGPFADIANTVISAGRGIYSGVTGDTTAAKKHAVNTGLNLVSAIPVIGDTISAPKAIKAGANLAQKAVVKGKKVKSGANILQAANIINPAGNFQPSVDMNQTFASETTGVRPPIIPEMMNLPKFPQQPPIPKIGPSTRKNGGVKLPGGVAKPIPGSDAIEFKGRSHAQGGIMVDPMTEVEGNETMDKVTMNKGGKRDYFFSQHLKMGGKSFAQRHKDILKKGGSQKDIDSLAKLQEKKAGRNPNTVKLGAGGYYQGGGMFKKNPNDFGQTYDDGTPVYNDQGLVQPPASLVQDFQNRMFPQVIQDPVVGDFDPITDIPSASTTSNTKNEPTNTTNNEEERIVDGNVELLDPIQVTQIPVDDTMPPTLQPIAVDENGMPIESDYNSLSDEDKSVVDKANSGADLTDLEKKALKRLRRDVPGLAIGAGVAQLIAPAYAFFKKDRVAEQMGAPGRIKAPTLDRVSYNTERAANAADNRAMNRFIETSGIGPAGIIAKMSAYRRKQEGDLKIAAQESRVNTQIANQEAQMAQQANARNVANAMQADQINTQLREAQLAANQDRRLEAIDSFTERTAGLAGDLMAYKGTERLARATGDMGIYERDRLRTFLKNQVNPRTGQPYTNAEIAELFNKRFGEAQATKEDKEDKQDEQI